VELTSSSEPEEGEGGDSLRASGTLPFEEGAMRVFDRKPFWRGRGSVRGGTLSGWRGSISLVVRGGKSSEKRVPRDLLLEKTLIQERSRKRKKDAPRGSHLEEKTGAPTIDF